MLVRFLLGFDVSIPSPVFGRCMPFGYKCRCPYVRGHILHGQAGNYYTAVASEVGLPRGRSIARSVPR